MTIVMKLGRRANFAESRGESTIQGRIWGGVILEGTVINKKPLENLSVGTFFPYLFETSFGAIQFSTQNKNGVNKTISRIYGGVCKLRMPKCTRYVYEKPPVNGKVSISIGSQMKLRRAEQECAAKSPASNVEQPSRRDERMAYLVTVATAAQMTTGYLTRPPERSGSSPMP